MEFPFFKKGNKDEQKPELKQEWESCQPDKTVTRGVNRPRSWAPNEFGVKILVASSIDNAKQAAKEVMKVQQELQAQFRTDFPNTKLMMSLETYHDNERHQACRHSAGWSENPIDMESGSTRWHCYTTNTQVAQSLRAMASGTERAANVIILVGNKLDENPQQVAQQAKILLEQKKTQIFTIPLPGTSQETVEKFRTVGVEGGGMILEIPRNDRGVYDYAPVIREVAKHSMYKTSGRMKEYLALPAPDAATAAVRKQLEQRGPK